MGDTDGKSSAHGHGVHNPENQDTPVRLIRAGIVLFSKHGFEGTSVKQIAEQAGVNVSLVSYHFNGKEGLYRACFEYFGREKLAGPVRILQPVASKEELRIRLNLFLEEFWSTNIEEVDVMCMIHREEETGFAVARDIFMDLFVKIFETFVSVVRDAQTKGFVRKDLDVQMIGSVFFGAMVHNLTKDHINEQFFKVSLKQPEYRKKLASTLVTTILEGCLSD